MENKPTDKKEECCEVCMSKGEHLARYADYANCKNCLCHKDQEKCQHSLDKNREYCQKCGLKVVEKHFECLTCGRKSDVVKICPFCNPIPTWQEDFDKEFKGYWDEEMPKEKIKKFISQVETAAIERGRRDVLKLRDLTIEEAIKEERQRIVDLVEGMKFSGLSEQMKKMGVAKQCDWCGAGNGFESGYDQALEDFISKINAKL